MATYVDFSVIDGITDFMELQSTYRKLLKECRVIAGKRLSELLSAANVTPTEIVNATGQEMVLSDASHVIAGNRFPKLHCLGIICHNFLGISCNNLLTGIDVPLRLPGFLNNFMIQLSKLSPANTRKIAIKLMKEYENFSTDITIQKMLIRERLIEYADDNAISPYNCFSVKHAGAPNAHTSEEPKLQYCARILETNDSSQPTTAIAAARLSGLPVDYFIVDNYTKTVPEIQYKKFGKWTTIKDSSIIAILSLYLSLPDEEKDAFFTKTIRLTLS